MLLHFPKRPNLYADLLSPDEFYSPIDAIMDSRRAEFGFVRQVLGDALDRAMEFFTEYQTTDDLLPLFERLRCYEGEGLGYWNYSNMPLAHAFTLRVSGHYTGGKSLLDQYARRTQITGSPLVDLLSRFERATASTPVL
jgi:hypothetical protein